MLYNEIHPFVVRWLRNLCEADQIPFGFVDDRPIQCLGPKAVSGNKSFHAFAGIGGWPYALRIAGWPDDKTVWTGSCPCQPFSIAGKRKKEADERHLWPFWRDLIAECSPPIIFGEQVASPLGRAWLAVVQIDLEALGYRTAAADLCAAGIGAPHIRQRLFFGASRMGNPSCENLWWDSGYALSTQDQSRHVSLRHNASSTGERMGNPNITRLQRWIVHQESSCVWSPWAAGVGGWRCIDGKTRPFEPGILPVAHGIPERVEFIRAFGNAIVPQVAAVFIRAFMEALCIQ